MPTYQPITKAQELPEKEKDVEHETLDFKAKYDLGERDIRHEIAKDLAMFANHLGGTVLVGAAEDRATKRLRGWAPMSATDAGRLKDAAEQALEQLSPRPLLTVDRIAVEGGEVVALNVEAIVGSVVGVRQPNQYAYTFPIRRASQCAFLSPEVLPMYMLPEYRKTVLLLNKIGTKRSVNVLNGTGQSMTPESGHECYIESVNPDLNLVTLAFGTNPVQRVYFHIDGVEYVFQREQGRASVQLKRGASFHDFSR